MLPLLTTPGQLRRFLLVTAQSSVGNSMGYVALILVAHTQFASAWALAVVLVANLIPSAFFSPYFGQLADRHSRMRLCVIADVLCACAFTGIALSDNFLLTAILTFVAGCGAALFRTASRAAVPALAGPSTDAAVGAVVTASTAAGLIGPAIGAVILLVAPVESLLLINALTFAVSAYVLLGLAVDHPKPEPKPWVPMSLDDALADERFRSRAIREGFHTARAIHRLPLVILTSAAATFALGFGNIGEPLLITGPLGGDDSSFSLMVAVFGAGATIGALLGAASLRRMLASILAGAAVMACIAIAPSFPIALVFFALGGVVEGVSISCDDRLVTSITPDRILGRTFGLKDALDSLALLSSFLTAALVASLLGPRWVFAASAVIVGLVGVAALLVVVNDRQRWGPRTRTVFPAPGLTVPSAEWATPPASHPSPDHAQMTTDARST